MNEPPAPVPAAGGSALGYADAELGKDYAATDTYAKTEGDAKVCPHTRFLLQAVRRRCPAGQAGPPLAILR